MQGYIREYPEWRKVQSSLQVHRWHFNPIVSYLLHRHASFLYFRDFAVMVENNRYSDFGKFCCDSGHWNVCKFGSWFHFYVTNSVIVSQGFVPTLMVARLAIGREQQDTECLSLSLPDFGDRNLFDEEAQNSNLETKWNLICNARWIDRGFKWKLHDLLGGLSATK